MHLHCTHGMRMLERTSLGRLQRAVERFGTAEPGVAARPSSPGVEPLRLATMAASVGPPGEGKSGPFGVHGSLSAALTRALRRRYGSLYTCWDAVSGCSHARDGMHVRPVRLGGFQSE